MEEAAGSAAEGIVRPIFFSGDLASGRNKSIGENIR
jgi:hypothetical protein